MFCTSQVGDTLEFKGPILKLPYKANEYEHIGMVAGGTGITPMLQVVDEVLANPADKTKISLVFGNQSEADMCAAAVSPAPRVQCPRHRYLADAV